MLTLYPFDLVLIQSEFDAEPVDDPAGLLLLLRSRLYPNNDDETRKLYRGLVQNAIAQCLGVPNLWNVKSKPDESRAFLEMARHFQKVTGVNRENTGFRNPNGIEGVRQPGEYGLFMT